jgi:DNA primase
MMNNVEYLKARIDLVTYVQSCVPSLHKEGRLFVACCPFHTEKHASFKVNPDMQIVTCFGACGKTWDLIGFAEAYHRTDFQGALEELAQYAGIELVSPIGKETHSHKRLYALLECAEQWFRFRLNPDVIDYLIKTRGLTPETIANAGIGYAPNTWQSLYNWLVEQGYTDKEMLDAGICGRSDKTDKLYDFFRGRVMIPMRDSKHRVVGFTGRAFDEGIEPRYKNSPQSEIFDKGRLI